MALIAALLALVLSGVLLAVPWREGERGSALDLLIVLGGAMALVILVLSVGGTRRG